jgi:hypothetical protein
MLAFGQACGMEAVLRERLQPPPAVLGEVGEVYEPGGGASPGATPSDAGPGPVVIHPAR